MHETTGGTAGTGRDRRRFVAALGLFVFWLCALGIMAVLSGRSPEPTPTAIEDR